MVLPSFTEATPYVVDEALSRKRPVIIFEDIAYIVRDKKGIFVSERNVNSFSRNYKIYNGQLSRNSKENGEKCSTYKKGI